MKSLIAFWCLFAFCFFPFVLTAGQSGKGRLQFASLGDFRLESGQTIYDCQIGYRVYGKMNLARSNIILFPTWFSGTTADLETAFREN